MMSPHVDPDIGVDSNELSRVSEDSMLRMKNTVAALSSLILLTPMAAFAKDGKFYPIRASKMIYTK